MNENYAIGTPWWEREEAQVWIGAGACTVLLFYFLPYLLHGKDAVIRYSDQLDSLVVYYRAMVESDQVFALSNSATIEQLMGSVPRNAMPPSFHVTTLLFYLFEPFMAYILNLALRTAQLTSPGGVILRAEREQPERG